MQGWLEIESHLRSGINKFLRDSISVNPNDADNLIAHKERASYMAGKVAGAEWLLNEFASAVQEEQNLQDQIKEAEAEIKSGRQKEQ